MALISSLKVLYLNFCPDLFGHMGIWFDKKAKFSFKIYDITTWETNKSGSSKKLFYLLQ